MPLLPVTVTSAGMARRLALFLEQTTVVKIIVGPPVHELESGPLRVMGCGPVKTALPGPKMAPASRSGLPLAEVKVAVPEGISTGPLQVCPGPASGPALRAFLVAMDDSGQGQAKQRGVVQADQLVTSFTRVVRDELAGGDPEDARAFGLFLARDCMRCHVPFSRSSLGPDLSTVLDRMTVDEVHEVLQEGRKLMPAARLEPEQREQIIRYFGWLRRNRQTIQARSLAGSSRVTFQPFDLPWWEYR